MMAAKNKVYAIEEDSKSVTHSKSYQKTTSIMSKETQIVENATIDQMFSFLFTFRFSNWIIFGFFMFLHTIQSYLIIFQPEIPFGDIWGDWVNSILFNAFSLGMTHYLDHDSYKYVTSIIIVVLMGFIILLVISYRYYVQGVSFRRIKFLVRLFGICILVVTGPFVTLLSIFWSCNLSTFTINFYPQVYCFDVDNILWGFIGLIFSLLTLVITSFALFWICDLKVGKNSSLFSTNYPLLIVYDFSSMILLLYLNRTFFKIQHWISPIAHILQSLLAMMILVKELPFFRRPLNSIYGGILLSRIVISIIIIITVLVNSGQNDRVIGIIFGVCTTISIPIGLAIGIFCFEMYTRFIVYKAQQYQHILIDNENDLKINPTILEIGCRFQVPMEKYHPVIRSSIHSATSRKYETSQLYITHSLIYIYFSTDTPLYASHCLKKAMSFRPNFLTKMNIFLRLKDLDHYLDEGSEEKRIIQIINSAKKRTGLIQYYTKQFWRNLLGDQKNVHKCMELSEEMEKSMSNASRVFNNLIYTYPKNHIVIRAYGNFIEYTLHDSERAKEYYEEADILEEEHLASMRKKTSKMVGDSALKYSEGTKATESGMFSSRGSRSSQDDKRENLNDLNFENGDIEKEVSEGDVDDMNEDSSSKRLEETTKRLIMIGNSMIIPRLIIMGITVVGVLSLTLFTISDRVITKMPEHIIMDTCDIQAKTYEIINHWRILDYSIMANNFSNLLMERSLDHLNKTNEFLRYIANHNAQTIYTQDDRRISFFLRTSHTFNLPIFSNQSVFFEHTNATLYDSILIFRRSLVELTNNAENIINSSTSNPHYLFIWSNTYKISSLAEELCLHIAMDKNEISRQYLITFMVIIGVVALAHAIYFLCFFFPIITLVLKTQKSVIQLFLHIPKEVMGNIYHSIMEDNTEYEFDKLKHKIIVSTKTKILLCCFLIMLIELMSVVSLVYNYAVDISDDEVVSDVFLHTSETTKFSNLVLRNVGEIMFLSGGGMFEEGELHENIEEMRKYWNLMKFGKQSGISGSNRYLDRLISEGDCLEKKIECESINYLMEEVAIISKTLSRQHPTMTIEQKFNSYYHLYSIVSHLDTTLPRMARYFSDLPDLSIPFDLIWIYVAACTFLVITTYPLHVILGTFVNITNTIRRMLIFIPVQVIESIPEIRNYVHHFKLPSKVKGKKNMTSLNGSIKMLLEIVIDGLIIVNASKGTIIDMNSAIKSMFGMSNTMDVTGKNLTSLFVDHDKISNILTDVAKLQKSSTCELIAKHKNGSKFPVRLTAQYRVMDKRSVIILVLKDVSISKKQKLLLEEEKKRSEELLLNILPHHIAQRLKKKQGDQLLYEKIEDVTILFSDIVGFTTMSSKLSAFEVVNMLNSIVNSFDSLCKTYELEKIKTIGDAYFLVGGLSGSDDRNHPERVIKCGMAMIHTAYHSKFAISIRVGVHTGGVVAGIIGTSKFAYDMWGDAVNVASRMESTGIPLKIQCSRATYERVHDLFDFEERKVQVKGKGQMTTYVLQHTPESFEHPNNVKEPNKQHNEKEDVVISDRRDSDNIELSHQSKRTPEDIQFLDSTERE